MNDEAQLDAIARRLRPTSFEVDIFALSEGDRGALKHLIAAGRVVDRIYRRQLWDGNEELADRLQRNRSAVGQKRLRLFNIFQGSWSDLDDYKAFLPDVPDRKPKGAAFYPSDLEPDEFEQWLASLSPQEAAEATSFFTVIERDENRALTVIPYSAAYRPLFEELALHLNQAAAIASSDSLRKFLQLRAEALFSNDYYDSDVAWMEVEGAIDVTIGPYETYTDELYGYKAAFEAYICLRDEQETARVQSLSSHLQLTENNLPVADRYKNRKLGATTPITVVNEIYAAGDANHGVQAAAFNLPNDERVVLQAGSKKVMLKNVQQAKFATTLLPIADRVLTTKARSDVDFDSFFIHILAHELSHGIGPQTGVRLQLKDLYSAFEEAKADITALFMLHLLRQQGVIASTDGAEARLYHTYLASGFRTLRFGMHEAHGRGMALQMNYLLHHGAIKVNDGPRFEIDGGRMRMAVHDLTQQILTIEAEGNYDAAAAMLTEWAVIGDAFQKALRNLDDLPVDLSPVFVTAEQLCPSLP